MQEIQFGYATQAGIHWLTGAESTGQSVLRHVLRTGVARSGFFRLFSTPGWVVARGWVMPWQTPPIEAELYLSATPTGMTIHMAQIIDDEVRTYAVSPIGSRTYNDGDRSPFEWDDDAATELVVSYFRNGGRLDEADVLLNERIALRRRARLSSAVAARASVSASPEERQRPPEAPLGR